MHLRTLSSRIFVVLASLMLLGSARAAGAQTITLMWDPTPEPAVAGYIVHVGTQPAAYTQHIDVGLSTGYSFSDAVRGQQYCFAVSAYVAGPIEGGLSNEVCGFSNRPPTLVNPGSRTSHVSQATTLQLQGVDPDGQPVTYGATGLPVGLTLQSSTGFISGAPTTAGTFTVNATVSDGVLSASQSFTWTITVTARDAAGNTRTAVLTVTYTPGDTVAPNVRVVVPTSADTYVTSVANISLRGFAGDDTAVTLVTWSSNRGDSGIAAGTWPWRAPSPCSRDSTCSPSPRAMPREMSRPMSSR